MSSSRLFSLNSNYRGDQMQESNSDKLTEVRGALEDVAYKLRKLSLVSYAIQVENLSTEIQNIQDRDLETMKQVSACLAVNDLVMAGTHACHLKDVNLKALVWERTDGGSSNGCGSGEGPRRANPPVYDYKKCIRCFCCQEVCPDKAISVVRPWLNRMLFRSV